MQQTFSWYLIFCCDCFSPVSWLLVLCNKIQDLRRKLPVTRTLFPWHNTLQFSLTRDITKELGIGKWHLSGRPQTTLVSSFLLEVSAAACTYLVGYTACPSLHESSQFLRFVLLINLQFFFYMWPVYRDLLMVSLGIKFKVLKESDC